MTELHYTYDPATAAGQVRFHIGDCPDNADATLTGRRRTWKCVLADEEIAQALLNRSDDPLLAASDLLLGIASNQALLEASITVNGYSRDPKGISAQLRAQAAQLLAQATNIPAEAIVELYGSDFQTRDKILRKALPVFWDAP